MLCQPISHLPAPLGGLSTGFHPFGVRVPAASSAFYHLLVYIKDVLMIMMSSRIPDRPCCRLYCDGADTERAIVIFEVQGEAAVLAHNFWVRRILTEGSRSRESLSVTFDGDREQSWQELSFLKENIHDWRSHQ